MENVKIILDADVLIHFSKAGCLSILPSILPEYEYTILSTVYNEVKTIQNQIDNQVILLRNITLIPFAPTGKMRLEYAKLLSKYGKGESACMAYCKFTNNVIGSSNLKDILEYCTSEGISFLTTLDFLYYAFSRGIMTKMECDEFIKGVNEKGSKVPVVDITTYTPHTQL